MNIKVKGYMGTKETTLCIYIASVLDGDDYGVGAVEVAKKTADNCVEAFARLCEVLVTKNMLDLQDVVKIINGNVDNCELIKA